MQMEDIHEIEDKIDLHSILIDDHQLEPPTPSCEMTTETNLQLLRGDSQMFNEHNYSTKEAKVPVQYKCDDCGYSTNRKNTFVNHLTETCKSRRCKGLLAAKDKKCKYCLKMMRHNALRAHLRHFINSLKANRKPKGKHSSISLQEFVDYLEEIKSKV